MKTDTVQQNIPRGWKQVILATVSDIVMGQSPDSSSYNKDGEGLPFFQGKADFTDTYKTTIRQWTSEPTKIAEPADTLVSVRAPVGDVAINNVRACIGRGLAAVRAKQQITDQVYLFYILQSLKTFFNTKAQGSTFTAINGPELRKISIILPPIKEQQKIAEILGTVDEDIAKTQEVIGATEKLKRGLMQQLFTRGIGHIKFKETKIGQVPESWSVVPVSEVVKKIVDNRGKTPPLSSDGVGMIEVNAIDSSQKHPNYSRISKYVSQETYDSWFRSGHPEKGDILIPTVGTVGVAVIMNENEGCIAQNIIAVRVKDTILPDFFYYLVISPLFVDQIRKVLMGAVQPSLKVPHMLAFNIPLPTKPEQKEIAEILSAVDEKISINKKLKGKLTLLKKGLMQDLLSGKVRV